MTQPTGEYDSYDITGIREDLANWVSNIAPWETPFLTRLSVGEKPGATLFEWQKDSLPSATANAAVEGDQPTNVTVTATTKLNNRCMISQHTIEVSDTSEELEIAGQGPSQLDYQIARYSRTLKTDMETNLTANTAKAAGSSSSARYTAGVMSWLKTNQSKASNGTAPTGDGTDTRQAGTARAFTEALLRAVMLACYGAGANPSLLMLSPFNKQALSSGFTGAATRNIDAKDKKLVATIDIYVSDFGQLEVVPNRLMPTSAAFVLDMEMWEIRYLRTFRIVDLAKTADATRKQLICEYGLCAKNEAGNGIVADLTTS